jgi:competence protein ComEA
MLILIFVTPGRGTVRQQELPEGEGKELFAKKCSQCHSLEDATASRRTRGQWDGIIQEMTELGAQFTDEEKSTILGYLSKNFGKINVNVANADQIESFLGLSADAARAIVTYRTEHGDFKSIDDLKKVPGVDLKVLDEKKGWIAF